MSAPTSTSRHKITAFVLAGGGSLGAVQVGMLRALLEGGVRPDFIVGSSVGAINAAYFAGNPTISGVSALESLWLSLKRSDILPLSWRGLLGFLHWRDYVIASDGLRSLLEVHLPYRNLEDATLPVHVVATDIFSGEAVLVSRGLAARAVLASSAIPAAFAPVEIDGRRLCDGAIASNTPVQAAVACGAHRLIVLPTGVSARSQRAPAGAIANALHALTLMTTRQLAAELDQLGESVDCRILPAAVPPGVSAFDFSRTPELIARGYESTVHWISKGGVENSAIHAAFNDRSYPRLESTAQPPIRGHSAERFALEAVA